MAGGTPQHHLGCMGRRLGYRAGASFLASNFPLRRLQPYSVTRTAIYTPGRRRLVSSTSLSCSSSEQAVSRFNNAPRLSVPAAGAVQSWPLGPQFSCVRRFVLMAVSEGVREVPELGRELINRDGFAVVFSVRLTPDSGQSSGAGRTSAKCQKRTLHLALCVMGPSLVLNLISTPV